MFKKLKKLSDRIFKPYYDQYPRELSREIEGSCSSLLDVGCGARSPLTYFKKRLTHTVGVDADVASVEESRRSGIHDDYRVMNILDIKDVFEERSFDAVLLSDLIEHIQKPEAFRLLRDVEKIAKKKVIIFTPNGFLPQGELDNNPYQRHVSGWNVDEMSAMGYRVIGLNGWKPLRKEHASIAWWPSFFWGKVSLLTQPWVRERPRHAFHLFCVKEMDHA